MAIISCSIQVLRFIIISVQVKHYIKVVSDLGIDITRKTVLLMERIYNNPFLVDVRSRQIVFDFALSAANSQLMVL